MARMMVAWVCIAVLAASAFADSCPYASDTTGRNCCTDEQCQKAVNSKYVYCNMAVMQCNACGNGGAPACPGSSTTTQPSTTPTSTTTPSGCPVTPGNGFCCADTDCTANGQKNVYCNKDFNQCNACGTVGSPPCPTTPTTTPTAKPTTTPTGSPTVAPTGTPTTSATPTATPAGCPVTPGGGFCCSDSDCTANGQKNVYCNKQYYQCNACGTGAPAPACPSEPTVVPTVVPTGNPSMTPTATASGCPVTPGNGFCCSDADCKKGGQTLVYCNKAAWQCNACGNGDAPPCP